MAEFSSKRLILLDLPPGNRKRALMGRVEKLVNEP